jgi:LuxR family transcriptional regulator, maltose regulon positive regulatory protein
MPETILATKLFRPPPRPNAVLRPGLVGRLSGDQGPATALTLISAPAGFGKSTLLSAWVDQCARQDAKLRVAWLSLDEGDSDPFRFLLYVAAALHGAEPSCGLDAMAALQSPRPSSVEAILTDLINEIDGIAGDILLVLDDFHAVHSPEVDKALGFLLDHLPARLRLAIATREDPLLPLARLRARGELAELRAADLRFSTGEAAEFLRRVMGLDLASEDVAALEHRTEGWVAGLQMAALSLRGEKDAAGFIRSFTGSHRFVLDYLGEEVLRRQPEDVQAFLLRTSILDRFCGPLCDALTEGESGQRTLEYLERANLFLVPLDGERKWYRYHRLFGELLRQRLEQSLSSDKAGGRTGAAGLHLRASEWFEGNGMPIEAFHHAVAVADVDRAERLVNSIIMPLHYRGAVIPILDWIASLPAEVLDAHPSLRVQFASMSLFSGTTAGVEDALEAAEQSLQHVRQDETTRDLVGRIATSRAAIALTRYHADDIMIQSRCALEYLRPDNVFYRLRITWTVAFAHSLQGDRAAARLSYAELERTAQVHGIAAYVPLALLGLGDCHVLDNELRRAADSYRRALRAFGDHSQPITAEIYHGLARILYEWNDLDAAEEHAERGLQLARQYSGEIDRFILLELLLARIALARGRVAAAAARLDTLAATANKPVFRHRLPEVAALQVSVFLRQGRLEAAAQLAGTYDIPPSRARVMLARDDSSGALAALEPLREKVESRGWQDEILRVRVLRALALHAKGEENEALRVLAEAMEQAEGGGFVRLFLDESAPMARLLSVASARGAAAAYTGKLLAAFAAEKQVYESASAVSASWPAAALVEPLSEREREVLALLAEGLSNQEIGERLFLALDTIKGHNRRIFEKLEVKRRTEAIARGRELGLL